MSGPDLDVIKEIPGYRVILKAVLKNQIQQLVEQLASHTEEETVILTASVSDGTLSHLGSDSGKFFLDDHEDIKSQFLGFCLKRHHRKKQEEEEQKKASMSTSYKAGLYQVTQRSPYNKSPATGRGTKGNNRHHPYSNNSPSPRGSKSINQTKTGAYIGYMNSGNVAIVKPDPDQAVDNTSNNANVNQQVSSDENNTNVITEQDVSNQISHGYGIKTDTTEDGAQSSENTAETGDNEQVVIKVEPVYEGDLDLEITGVQLGPASVQDSWEPDSQIMDQSGSSIMDQSGSSIMDQSAAGTSFENQQTVNNTPSWMAGQALDINIMQHPKQIFPSDRSNSLTCDLCGKKFSSRSNLGRHIRVHSGRKDLQCRYCPYKTDRSDNFKLHMWTQHNCLNSDK